MMKPQTGFDSLSSTDCAVCELNIFEAPALYKSSQLVLITFTL